MYVNYFYVTVTTYYESKEHKREVPDVQNGRNGMADQQEHEAVCLPFLYVNRKQREMTT